MPIREDERKLEEPLVTELVSELDGWTSDGKRIEKTFVRKGFRDAVAFVNGVAKEAEAVDHHPDIHLEGYKRVRIVLTTHVTGGISRSDIDLAKRIDAIGAQAAS